jgi:hypothetical protein
VAGRRLVYHDRRDRVLFHVVHFPDPDPDLCCPGHVHVHGNAVMAVRVRDPIDVVEAVRCSVSG